MPTVAPKPTYNEMPIFRTSFRNCGEQTLRAAPEREWGLKPFSSPEPGNTIIPCGNFKSANLSLAGVAICSCTPEIGATGLESTCVLCLRPATQGRSRRQRAGSGSAQVRELQGKECAGACGERENSVALPRRYSSREPAWRFRASSPASPTACTRQRLSLPLYNSAQTEQAMQLEELRTVCELAVRRHTGTSLATHFSR